MNKKTRIILLVVCFILIIVLWYLGIIPKQIGKIYGTYYMYRHFPEWKVKYEYIEWDKYFGSYVISFIDKNGDNRGCLIGPKYFPVSMGQGIFALEEEYRETFLESNNENTEVVE